MFGAAVAQPARERTYVNYDSLVIAASSREANLLRVQPHATTTGAFVIAD